MQRAIFTIVCVVFFFAIGVWAFAFPRQIQTSAIKSLKKFDPLRLLGFAESGSYIWMLRVIGVWTIAAALLLLYIAIFGSR